MLLKILLFAFYSSSILPFSFVDISKIYKKGFSSKGTNRGIGLYLVSKIIKDNDWLSLSQEFKNNKFISILKIKGL